MTSHPGAPGSIPGEGIIALQNQLTGSWNLLLEFHAPPAPRTRIHLRRPNVTIRRRTSALLH